MILLVADLQELKANPKRAADRHDRRGPARQGPRRRSRPRSSRPARSRSATSSSSARRSARVRALENEQGKRVTKAGPSSAVVVLGLSEVPEARRHPARRRRREGSPDDGRDPQGRGRGQGRRRQRPGDPRGPLPPDPGRPGQGAADHPQGRRVGLARRDHPRARAARPGRDPAQRPPRGRRRHHRQRHHAGVGLERDRRRLQHEDHRHRPSRRRGRRASTSGCTTSSTS